MSYLVMATPHHLACRQPLLLEQGAPAHLALQSKEQLRKGGDFIPGFTKSEQQVLPVVYPPPEVPASFQERHVLPPKQQPQGQAGAAGEATHLGWLPGA